MVKEYNCKVCGIECAGTPQDQMIYHLELCGSDPCIESYMQAAELGLQNDPAYAVLQPAESREKSQ